MKTMLYAATDVGDCLIDGLGDGFYFFGKKRNHIRDRSFWIQIKIIHMRTGLECCKAARTRCPKTEYISMSICGRTLFDLQKPCDDPKANCHLEGVEESVIYGAAS